MNFEKTLDVDKQKPKTDGRKRDKDLMDIQRDLSISLAATDDLVHGLHLSLDASLKASGMDCGGIYLFDDISGELNLIHHTGISENYVRSVASYDKDSANVKFVRAGQPAYPLHREVKVPLTEDERAEGLRALAILPILNETQVIGCLNLASRTFDEVPFSSRIALEAIAAVMGCAIARLKASEMLHESEEHFRSLMESATNFVVYRLMVNAESTNELSVLFVSPSLVDIIGVSDPYKFDSWFENIHTDDRERIIKANLRAFKTLKFNEIMKIYHPLKGEWRWIHAVSTGIPDRKGKTKYVNGIIIDITKRKLFENALKAKEKELRAKASALEEMNTALKVLLNKRQEDKTGIEENFLANIKELVIPYLEKAKGLASDENLSSYLDIIDANLNTIITPFSRRLSTKYLHLTPTEIQVADLVKHGKCTKDIAKLLRVSVKTVETHRLNIRKKFGIKNKKANLRTFLLSLNS